MKTFFMLILDIGAVNDHCIDAQSRSLCRNLNRLLQLSKGDGGPDFASLMRWIHSYGACTPSLITTFMNSLCSEQGSIPSFSPFYMPSLDVASEIASAAELSPLALYSTGPQGLWKKLYTTSCDGLVFDRIVHHVLGYKVISYFNSAFYIL